MGTCHVADSDHREMVILGFTGSGIDTVWAGGSVAGADDVGANGKPTFRIEKFSGFGGMWPPVCNFRIGC